jgi:hypothetical protein
LALFKDVVRPRKSGGDDSKPKMFNLSGTACIFKKAIPPFAKYEISSRILCSDENWVYAVNRLARPGSNISKHSLLVGDSRRRQVTCHAQSDDQIDCICATGITKYVFK